MRTRKSPTTIAILLLSLFLIVLTINAVEFKVNMSQQTKFAHYWERCVGSGHAALGQRQDWREHLLRAHKELGFQMVRFHGLLDQDMSVVLKDRYGKQFYSFYNVDYLFDHLLSIGMKPLVELSYMPDLLASGPQTLFHYKANVTPPKTQAIWYDLIYNLVKHLVDRYGLNEIQSWHFEVWNEPNNGGFWSGTQQQYFELYNTTASAIKAVDKSITVGGPATMQSLWLEEFLEYCTKNRVPFDFVSTHEYPTDIQPFHRDNMKKAITKARATVNSYAGKDFPLFYTEWNAGLDDIGGGTQFYQDSSYAAAFVVKNIADMSGVVDIFSYWVFSDIFEEQGMKSQPFNGQFGMLNIHGIPKPVYRAFELLHKSGDMRANVEYSSGANASSVDVLATVNNQEGELMIFVANYDVPTNKPYAYDVLITISSDSPFRLIPSKATIQRVDQNHANSFQEWLNIGQPDYLSKDQIAKLHLASQLKPEPIQFNYDSDKQAIFKVKATEYSLSVITAPFIKK